MTSGSNIDNLCDEDQYREAVLATESGDERSKTKVAFFMLTGRGGAQVNAERAVELLEERVKKGDYEASWLLGLCCEYGIGTRQDFEREEMLYEQSCQTRNPVDEFLYWNAGSMRGNGIMKRRGGL